MDRFLTFDTELASIIEDDGTGNWAERGPFDFSVAAVSDQDGATRIWHSVDSSGGPASIMSRETALELLRFLRTEQERGVPIVTWNGLGFDFRWLGVAAGDPALAARIALDHFDPMFQFHCQRGFPVSLAKVGEGLGIPQTKLMSGKDAPIAWRDGRRAEVIEYVRGDVQLTAKILRRIVETGGVRWRTRAGSLSGEAMPKLLPVRDLVDLPLPDTSWMSDPIPRAKFFDWIPELAGAPRTGAMTAAPRPTRART